MLINPSNGDKGIIIVKQDSIGGRKLTLPANSYLAETNTGILTLSPMANAIDMLEWVFDGTDFYWKVARNFNAKDTLGYDLDAQNFMDAAGVEIVSQKVAIDNLVKSLKSANLWDKLLALYPFVGGNSQSHRYNLKDHASYKIEWKITGTADSAIHNANGVTFTGVALTDGSYGNTGIVPSSALSLNSFGFSFYSGSALIRENSIILGSYVVDAGVTYNARPNSTSYLELGGTVSTFSTNNLLGFHSVNRTNSTSVNIYRDGSLQFSDNASNSTYLPNRQITLGGIHYVHEQYISNMTDINLRMFAVKNQHFTTIEEVKFYQIIESYQVELGRSTN